MMNINIDKYKLSWILLPILICTVIFGNHYARDAVGALEKQLETKAFITTKLYANLNTFYFLPNTITPLLAGVSVDRLGGPAKCLLYSVTIANIGHILFSVGINLIINQTVDTNICIYIIIFGRCLAGTMYEVIDTIPLMILGPIYEKEWGILVGIMNAFLRMGSVLNFILCPILYKSYGLHAAFWVSTSIASFGSICALISIYLEKIIINKYAITTTFINNDKSSYNNTSMYDFIKAILPLHLFSKQFYYWTFGGGCLYGAMVPFWFIGSKYLQNYYSMSVSLADTLMLIPEGLIVIFSMPIGVCIDKYKFSLKIKLLVLSFSVFMLPVSYLMLVYGSTIQSVDLRDTIEIVEINNNQTYLYNNDHNNTSTFSTVNRSHVYISPYIAMILLGVGYAFSNCFFWSVIIPVVGNKDHLSVASGLVASVMNILPTIIPVIATRVVSNNNNNQGYLYILALVGIVSSLLFLIASYHSVSIPMNGSFDDKIESKIYSTNLNKITSKLKSYNPMKSKSNDMTVNYEMVDMKDSDENDDNIDKVNNSL